NNMPKGTFMAFVRDMTPHGIKVKVADRPLKNLPMLPFTPTAKPTPAPAPPVAADRTVVVTKTGNTGTAKALDARDSKSAAAGSSVSQGKTNPDKGSSHTKPSSDW